MYPAGLCLAGARSAFIFGRVAPCSGDIETGYLSPLWTERAHAECLSSKAKQFVREPHKGYLRALLQSERDWTRADQTNLLGCLRAFLNHARLGQDYVARIAEEF